MLPKFAAFESPQSASLTAPLVPKGSLGAYEFAEDSRKIGISCGRTESSAPTTRRGVKTTCRGRRLCRPEKCCEFAGDYCKNGALCRADVGIGPYKCEVRRLSKICSVRIPSVSFADSSPWAQGEPLARAFKHKNLAPCQGRGQSRYHPDCACAHLGASVSGSTRRAFARPLQTGCGQVC